MRVKSVMIMVISLFLTVPLFGPVQLSAEEAPKFVPNKLLCAQMIRFGQEAYQRGRFQEAKEYFRKATKADPDSKKAWRYYDQAVLFALAERVEQKENGDLLLPGIISGPRYQSSAQSSVVVTPLPTQKPAISTPAAPVAISDDEDEEEEEGC